MSFQINSADLKHGTEMKESVATLEEEFKNSTAEESEGKLTLEEEEEFKDRKTEKLKRTFLPEHEDESKNSRVEKSLNLTVEEIQNPTAGASALCFKSPTECKRTFELWLEDYMKPDWKIKVSVANSEEEFKNTTVEELKRKVLPEDEYEKTILVYHWDTLKKNCTLGFYGIKHEDNITKVPRGTTYTVTYQTQSSAGHKTEETCSFEDDDDEEVKDISRTQSMEYLAISMQKTNPGRML
ncbi:uncharacterized protein [Garra rufa]|uniref:uncharacterized protein n=1 Tax=Garra rufa TaxID=137080 RepID=UPI003CCE9E12